MNIRLIEQKDIDAVSEVYANAFNKADVGENWTIPQAKDFMNFWLNTQPDLFFIAEENGQVVGGSVGLIKPFWDGNNLTNAELFVDPEFQNQGIGRELLKKLIQEAKDKYEITSFNAVAYKNRKSSFEWYNRIGLRETALVYLEGDPREILENLK